MNTNQQSLAFTYSTDHRHGVVASAVLQVETDRIPPKPDANRHKPRVTYVTKYGGRESDPAPEAILANCSTLGGSKPSILSGVLFAAYIGACVMLCIAIAVFFAYLNLAATL